jgi:hypothetical protein
MDQKTPIKLALAIVVALVGLVGGAYVGPWYLRHVFILFAAIGTVISVALVANWFVSRRETSTDTRAASDGSFLRIRPLFLLTPAAAALLAPCRSLARLCGEAKVVLCCLGVHACVATLAAFFVGQFAKTGFADLACILLILSTGVGFGCGISSIRHQGLANRVTGILGLLWFGGVVLLEMAARR